MTLKEADYQPGDIGLCHSYGFVPWLIRMGERLRYRKGADSRWSHAFLLIQPIPENPGNWLCIEAESHGVQYCLLSQMGEYEVMSSKLDDRGRSIACEFAHLVVGSRYGFLTIASIVVNLLTPVIWQVSRPGSFICSGLVAHALEHGGTFLPLSWEASQVMPADLAFLFRQ